MCLIKYDRVGDVLQVLERKYKPKKVDFFKLLTETPLYIIAEQRKVIGLEFIGFKDYVTRYYRSRKKEFGFTKKAQAEDFIKGCLYNLFKTELQGGKVVKPHNIQRQEVTLSMKPPTVKENIKELCSV